MAHESFEDAEVAKRLNDGFVSIKVDREERPDVDSVYMAVCQAMTGNGGWPMSVFMTYDQRPFFAGTYFPKTARFGTVGFCELLAAIQSAWKSDREALLSSSREILRAASEASPQSALSNEALIIRATEQYRASFDVRCGGFGRAPKFPAPHNLLFLMQQYQKRGDGEALHMAELTLTKMARGGLFDHVGFGFCRYSTDRRFLVPHFEKMLYDNALLTLAYCRAFELTGSAFYREVAEKTADYVLRELSADEGAFFSAQDADSDGEEGKYYVFTPSEVTGALGEADGGEFCRLFGITHAGNFEGGSIPNLLDSDAPFGCMDSALPRLRAYRKARAKLHTDDKQLTAWNSLMTAALCSLYRVTGNGKYLDSARRAQRFIEEKLSEDGALFVSFRAGKRGARGFLDDYAAYCFALLALYDVTLEKAYLSRASEAAKKAISDFFDAEHGGFALSGSENETLILNKKETYDGAIPSGNSLMAYALVRLDALAASAVSEELLSRHLAFMSREASAYPMGHAMYLMALSDALEPPASVTVVLNGSDALDELVFCTDSSAAVRVLAAPTEEYRLLDGQTAVYVCTGQSCLPPVSLRAYIANSKARRAEAKRAHANA